MEKMVQGKQKVVQSILMPRLPLVAIVGRPNTGKSSLFNRIIRQRKAIENEVAGTTRDHVAHVMKTPEVDYLLVDTGGMGGGTEDEDFEEDVHEQSLIALKAADLILFVLDGKEEPTSNDFAVAALLRKGRKRHVPVLMIINKCDNDRILEEARHAFHELGVDAETFLVSAAHGIGVPDVQDRIVEQLLELKFRKPSVDEHDANTPRVAIIGKPNVGKSSIVNALMSETQRSVSPKLVSPIAGTTRDSTDTLIRHQEQEYLFVDTAGLRRQTKVEFGVESLSMLRTIQSIEECDVAVLVLDGTEAISKQDKKIAGMVTDAGKGLVLLLNKADLMTSEQKKEKALEIKRAFLFCRWAPVLPVSAKTREGLLKIFPLAGMAQRNRLLRVADADMQQLLKKAITGQPMSALASAKHVTQGKDPPPTFVLFVKNPKAVQVSQLRYLENRLRETFGLEGTPVRFITKGPRDRKVWEDNN
jgi:GTPase